MFRFNIKPLAWREEENEMPEEKLQTRDLGGRKAALKRFASLPRKQPEAELITVC